jgi:hypothetical protein
MSAEKPWEGPIDELADLPPAEKEAEPRKRRGCLFYGCLSFLVLAVVLLVAAWCFVSLTVSTYTDASPRPLPVVTLPPERVEALQERAEKFEEAVKAPEPEGEDAGPPSLVLSEEEVNTLLFRENPGLRGKLLVRLGADRLIAELSLPLDFLKVRMFRGRYLNGRAVMNLSIRDGKVLAFIDDLEVNGKPLPKVLDRALKEKNLGEDLHFQPETQGYMDRITSLEVKEHRLVIRARPKPAEVEGEEAR